MVTFGAFGQCYPNKGNKIVDVQGYGPMAVAVQQWDDVDYLLAFLTKNATTGKFTEIFPCRIAGAAQETVRAGVSAFASDGVTRVFPHVVGAAGDLGFLFAAPVVPGTLQVIDPLTVAPTLRDINADGILYTIDSDWQAAGTIDYETGYLDLAYPAGKAPGTAPGPGAINVAFYSGTWLATLGNRLYDFAGAAVRDQLIRIVGLARKSGLTGCRLRVDAVFGW